MGHPERRQRRVARGRVTDDLRPLHGRLAADPSPVIDVFEGPTDGANAMLQADNLEGANRDQVAFRVVELIRDKLASTT